MRCLIPNDSLNAKFDLHEASVQYSRLKACGFRRLRQEQIDHTAGFTQVAEKGHGEINKMETEV
jgi:hypothetical protein